MIIFQMPIIASIHLAHQTFRDLNFENLFIA